MSDKQPILEEHTFDFDGHIIKVSCSVSGDRRYIECILEGSEPMSRLEVATIFGVCHDNLMAGVKKPLPDYAMKMN